MTTWYLNPALTNFRDAVNAAYPFRDKESDGTVGDEAHQGTSSDHNPDPAGEPDAGSVDAWDMDVEVNGKGKPYVDDIEELKRIFQNHESSRYWIHNREIASRSDNWRRRPYTGSNTHEKHVHWNTREAFENSEAPWPVEEEMEQTEKLINDTGSANRTVGNVLADVENIRNWLVSAPGASTLGVPPAGSVGAILLEAASNPPDVEIDVIALAQALAPLLVPQMEAAAEAAVRKVLGGLDE